MKLLAGESDFDVVYADRCDEGDILSAILRYRLYLPLEDYPGIKENLANLADGVADHMTYDGHLIGCPYQFGDVMYVVNEAFYETGLTVPDKNWTIDDFYELCEAAIPYCTEKNGITTALAFYPERWIISSIVQNGVDEGKLDRAELNRAAEMLEKYAKAGVFANYREADVLLLEYENIPLQMNVSYGREPGEVLCLPTVSSGKKYAPLESFVFVNHISEKPELAAKYIEMLLSDDFVHMTKRAKTLYAADPTSYYTLTWGDGSPMGNAQLKPNQWNKAALNPDGSKAYFCGKVKELFQGTTVSTVDLFTGGWASIREIFDELYSGKITADAAADKIYTYVNVRYME